VPDSSPRDSDPRGISENVRQLWAEVKELRTELANLRVENARSDEGRAHMRAGISVLSDEMKLIQVKIDGLILTTTRNVTSLTFSGIMARAAGGALLVVLGWGLAHFFPPVVR
jgi:hypothetical protein